ncbi:hypothetical protein RB598_002200 [Gaeumannomyces tritici]
MRLGGPGPFQPQHQRVGWWQQPHAAAAAAAAQHHRQLGRVQRVHARVPLLLGGAASGVSYTVFPANITGRPHNAPRLQLVVFLSGLARITLPSSSADGNDTAASFDVRGGRNGIIVAADTRDVSGLGHTTDYPGDEPTVVLQMPIAAGRLGFGRYSVLHEGPRTEEEMSGL